MTQIIMGENCNSELSDVSIITEDALLDPSLANAKLAKKKLKIEEIEENENGEKIVHIKENTSNLLCG